MRKSFLLSAVLMMSLLLVPSLVFSDSVEIIIEYEPAPNLDVDITTYPTTAVDPDTTITLTATVTNIGSDDATDTWLAWDLPSGWTITSGSMNVSLGTLASSASGTNSVSVDVGSGTGTFDVTASASCAEAASGSDVKNIGIGEPPEETTTTTTTTTQPPSDTPSSGPSSGPSAPSGPGVVPEVMEYSYSIEHSEFEIYKTIADNNILRIENTGSAEMKDVVISILGMPEDWYTIEKDTFESILPGESRRVDIIFHPPDTGTFNYEINITTGADTAFVGGTLIVKELTPQAEKELETKKTEEQIVEEAKRTVNVVSVLLVAFGVIGPAIIAIYMLTFLLRKRCPLCGSRMNVDYKGKNFTTYRCPTCNYFHTEEKGAEKKKKEAEKKGKETVK